AASSAAGQNNPVPFVNNPVVPSQVSPGSSSFNLAVNGTGFVPGSVIRWNGSPRATQFVNNAQLTATIPPSDIANPTTGVITIANPAPGGGVSGPRFVSVTVPTYGVGFTSTHFAAGSGPDGVGVGDVNNDGILDLVYTGGVNAVAVLLS